MSRLFHVSTLTLSLGAILALRVGAMPVLAAESDRPVPAQLTLVADPDSIPAGGDYATLLTATLTDADGQPVADRTVVFRTTAGHLTRPTAQTNPKGQAEVFLLSGPTPEVATVTARCGRLKATVSVVMYSGDAAPALLPPPPPSPPRAELKVKWDGGTGCAPPDQVVAGVVWVKLNVVYNPQSWTDFRHDWTKLKENFTHPNQEVTWTNLLLKRPEEAEPG
jgi:hypothetical protein